MILRTMRRCGLVTEQTRIVFQLVEESHKRGIKVIVDLVIDHCSKSMSGSKKVDLLKRDWLFWRPPKGYGKKDNPIPPKQLEVFLWWVSLEI